MYTVGKQAKNAQLLRWHIGKPKFFRRIWRVDVWWMLCSGYGSSFCNRCTRTVIDDIMHCTKMHRKLVLRFPVFMLSQKMCFPKPKSCTILCTALSSTPSYDFSQQGEATKRQLLKAGQSSKTRAHPSRGHLVIASGVIGRFLRHRNHRWKREVFRACICYFRCFAIMLIVQKKDHDDVVSFSVHLFR